MIGWLLVRLGRTLSEVLRNIEPGFSWLWRGTS